MSKDKNLLWKIAARLEGAYYDSLSTTERQIADLLIRDKILRINDDGNIQRDKQR